MMKTYRPGIFSNIISLILQTIVMTIIVLVIMVITELLLIPFIVYLFAVFVNIFMTISDLRYKIVIDNDNLYHYKGKKLLKQFKISECGFGYNIKKGYSTSREIVIIDQTGEKYKIDCTDFGKWKFEEILDIVSVDKSDIIEVQTIQSSK